MVYIEIGNKRYHATKSGKPRVENMRNGNKKGKSKKHYPVVRESEIQIDGSPDTHAVIRIDRALSARNHRLYRQSRYYTAKVDLDANAAQGTTVDVYVLGDSWMLQKAYQLAKRTFDENSAEEIAQLGSSKARWNDFRVDHGLGNAFQKDLVFFGHDFIASGNLFGDGEYRMSQVANALDQVNTFRFTGVGTGTWNIIDQYDLTGNTNAGPESPLTTIAYDGLTDEMDDTQMDHLSDDGNLPPYNRTGIANEVWTKVGTISIPTNGQQRLSTGYFCAPAGLVAIISNTTMDPAGSPFLNLEVKAGDYKGVHAPSMLE